MATWLVCLTLLTASALGLPAADVSTLQKHSDTTYPRRATFTYEPIKTGYVAFGESYAAGVGAGTTSGDSCRVGSSSYPNQLDQWVDSLQPGVNFQNLACSGAVVADVLSGKAKSQIDAWSNPGLADRATISIGGNDIGFYDVLTACVLRVGVYWAGDCDEEVAKAYDKMKSTDFNDNVATILRQIIAKSGRDDFQIVQTGYPAFFNVDTTICDNTTFYFWNPGHHGVRGSEDWAYLSQSLRLQLNNLVTDLNTQLNTIIETVNKGYSTTKVLFADPNPAFDGHRFCEEGVIEPDPNNEATWLLLASWPDYSASGVASAATATDLSIQTIPDASTCDTSTDWSELTLCQMGEAGIAHNTASGLALEPTIELPDGTKFDTSQIKWYYPTNYIKTFHPRTLGHSAYMDLVKTIW